MKNLKLKLKENYIYLLSFIVPIILMGIIYAVIKIYPFGNKNLITRVLPTSEVLISCENLGFNADNIIAMKGPFTQEMNESTYKQYDIDLVITKESGIAGGFLEKVNACKTLNIPVVIIKRKEMNYPNTIGNIEKLIDLI